MIGIGFGILSLEAVVRVFFPVSDFFWQWDPRIGMKLIPGKRGRSVKPGAFDVPVQANSAGFRDRDHEIMKPAGTRRIVMLGDSFLEALQVPFEQSITPMLEKRLNAQGQHTEFISLGVSGFGTAREYLALREYGLRYQPDLVLLFFVGNDVSDNSRRLQGLPYVPYPESTSDGDLATDEAGHPVFTPFADQSSRLSVVSDLLKDHVKSYRFLRETVMSSPAVNRILYQMRLVSTPPEKVNAPGGQNFGYYEIYRLQPQPTWAEAWRLTEGMLVATRDLAHESGAQFAVVLIPAAWEVDSSWWNRVLEQLPAMRKSALDLQEPSRRLTKFLGEHDIPVLTLLPEFRARVDSLPPLYVRSDAHWTAEGHRLATDLLADPVARLLDNAAGRPSGVLQKGSTINSGDAGSTK